MVTKYCVCFAHHRLVCSLVEIINVYVISVLPHRKESTVRKWRRRIRQEEIQGLKDLKKEKEKWTKDSRKTKTDRPWQANNVARLRGKIIRDLGMVEHVSNANTPETQD